MAFHRESPDIAETEASLANMSLASNGLDEDDMIPLESTHTAMLNLNDSDDASSDSSPSPSRKPAVPRSRAKKARKAAHQSQDQKSKPFLRPAKDILSRIRHDPALDEADFVVGYHDRHAPEIMEMDVASWKGGGDITDEEWIPQHRICYFRKKGEEPGRRVWDRDKRLDRLFGSGMLNQPDEQKDPMALKKQPEQEALTDHKPGEAGTEQADDAGDLNLPGDGRPD